MAFQCENVTATISQRSPGHQNTEESQRKGQGLSPRELLLYIFIKSLWNHKFLLTHLFNFWPMIHFLNFKSKKIVKLFWHKRQKVLADSATCIIYCSVVDNPVTGSVCVIAPKGCLWWQLLRNVSAHAFFRFWICRRIAIGSRTLQFGLPVGGIASNHNKIHTVCAVYFMKARGISLAMLFELANSGSERLF